jgi:hypothetical protein
MEGAEKQAALTAARNQSLFRAINEQIEGINGSFQVVLEDADYVCECAKNECMERIVMTLDEYREIRRVPTHFFVLRGHVYPDFERVVDERDGYVIVEKFGEAGAEAVALARDTIGA